MGEVVSFDKTGRAPRRMAWVCVACGRSSLWRYPTPTIFATEAHNAGWSDRCADAAVLVRVGEMVLHPLTRRCIGLCGGDGEKFRIVQDLHRRICLRDGKELHL